jgi:hypothetical protein
MPTIKCRFCLDSPTAGYTAESDTDEIWSRETEYAIRWEGPARRSGFVTISVEMKSKPNIKGKTFRSFLTWPNNH